MLWTDIQQAALQALKKDQSPDILACSSCSSTFFEEMEFKQFRLDHLVIPGQRVPTVGPEFYMLRCAKCGDLTEPITMYGNYDIKTREAYIKLVEAIKANDARKVPAKSPAEGVETPDKVTK